MASSKTCGRKCAGKPAGKKTKAGSFGACMSSCMKKGRKPASSKRRKRSGAKRRSSSTKLGCPYKLSRVGRVKCVYKRVKPRKRVKRK